MAEPPWKRRCLEKRARREAHLPPAWCLNAASLPASHQLDVSTVPLRSGKLTARELEITGIDEADMLLARLSDATFSAIEVATAFCKRATLAQQLVRISLLTSARACDDAAKTNCLTEVLFESALEQAKQLDHHLAHTGQTVGPLHGLPVSLKDQCQIKGVECCMGFASWLGDISDEDAVLVQILRKAGAVFYVRSNVPQTLLSAECDNHVFGRTCNPFNRSLSCGGSSGGEGALLGFGASIVGVGTDIGGSIRIPASYQGLYGLRPTTRRLPYYGLRNYLHGLEAIESSVGPMARTPGSCATFMRAVLHGEPHTSDPTVVELPWREELYRLPGRREKLSFGMLTCDDVVRPHPPILRALAMTRRALEAMGHEVFDWVPPVDHYELIQINTEIIFADGRRDWDAITKESKEPFHPLVESLGTYTKKLSVWDTWQLNNLRDRHRKTYLDAWQTTAATTSTGRPMDGLVLPVYPHAAPPLGDMDVGWHGYTALCNFLDYPACAFPVTTVDPRLDPSNAAYDPLNGLDQMHQAYYSPEKFANSPVGLQVAGRRFQDEAVLGMVEVIAAALAAQGRQART